MKNLVWGEEDNSESKPVTVDSDHAPKLTVETVNNHVYFYASVDSDRTLALLRELRGLDSSLRAEHISRELGPNFPSTPIWLHIQSGGGGLFTGFSAANQISRITTPIYSVVEGYCASAATLISMACTRRFIQSDAFMLIHQLSSVMWGKYEEFKDEMKILDMAMSRLSAFYVKRTRLSGDRVKELLQRDSWFDANESLELGMVDEILS